VLKVWTIRREDCFRFIQIGKEEIQLVLFANDNRKPGALIIIATQTVKEFSTESRYIK